MGCVKLLNGILMSKAKAYPCPTCKKPTKVKQLRRKINRFRVCKTGHRFFTTVIAGHEFFSAYDETETRKSAEYHKKLDRYWEIREKVDFIADMLPTSVGKDFKQALDNARARAGIVIKVN